MSTNFISTISSEIVRKISNNVGNICEFGTWKGATAILIAKLLDEEPMTLRKVLV